MTDRKIYLINESEVFKMENYKNQIALGFTSENELDQFLDQIAEDETLSARQYHYLRHFAITRFYEY